MSTLLDPDTNITHEETTRPPMTTSGTAVTIEPDIGLEDILIINASYGSGQTVAKGLICPDEYRLFKPFIGQPEKDPLISRILGSKSTQEVCPKDPHHPFYQELTDFDAQHHFALSADEINALGEAILKKVDPDEAVQIEWKHEAGSKVFEILNVTPLSYCPPKPLDPILLYELKDENANLITEGIAIGNQAISGSVVQIKSPDETVDLSKESILVTEHIDESWRPLLERVAGVITDSGSRISQGADLARALDLPAVLGTENATKHLKNNQEITLDCSQSERGMVYRDHLSLSRTVLNKEGLTATRARRLLSIDSPNAAQSWWQLPNQGFGLAKIETIINEEIGIHPRALLEYDEIIDEDLKRKIDRLTIPYDSREEYYIDRLARGIAHMAACAWPQPCVVRLNDFTSEEYQNLLDRGRFEPLEHNPKLGLRGASRYLDEEHQAAFELECQALYRARNKMGFHNIHLAIPFCRTVKGAGQVIDLLAKHDLKRGHHDLQLHLIAEVPSNIIICHEFMRLFDRIDIDLDTLTQTVLGIDPDDPTGSNAFDHLNPAVMTALNTLVDEAHCAGARVTIFGLLEDHRPELMDYLINTGIDAFAFEPENFIRGSLQILEGEKRYQVDTPANPNRA